MKPLLKTLVLCVALVAMTACSAQKRAERHIRKAVALCPGLVQVKAHPIDTVLTAPGFADMVAIPFRKVATGDTIYAATDHGTVVVSLRQSDSALRVGFVAAPQKVHYQDTLRISQVMPAPLPTAKEGVDWWPLVTWLLGIAVGAWMFVYLFKHTPIQKQ